MSESRTDQILDIAEERMKRGGFDAVSFRDIASAVGIKSASVHYHFPRKEDLGKAVVDRYSDRFFGVLGAPDAPGETPHERLARLATAYATALRKDGAMCLCTVLGSVSEDLPPAVADAVADFFDELLAWTDIAMSDTPARANGKATQLVSELQGAMILAVALRNPDLLDEAGRTILARFETPPIN